MGEGSYCRDCERAAFGWGACREVGELDERFEYRFHLSARWVDVPSMLGSQDWTPDISSTVLPARLKELRAPEAPRAEVLASDSTGLHVQLRWCPCLALRDVAGQPTTGAKYQVRFTEAPSGSGAQLEKPVDCEWQTQLPVLENTADAAPHETLCEVRKVAAGCTYRFAVRVGDAHRWSSWSPASEPLLLAVPSPTPSPGDVLEMSCEMPTSDTAQLEWRPFRTAPGIERLEYKVMALEWPYEELCHDKGVIARLKRTADLTNSGSGSRLTDQQSFRVIGYVIRHSSSSSQLRAQGDRMNWRVEGLRPGMYYRFFVCARYVALPLGALAPLPGSTPDPHSQNFMWPDEHCERLRGDSVAWEASLSRVGLWSPMINTMHLPKFAVRPMSLPQWPPGGGPASGPGLGEAAEAHAVGGGGEAAGVATGGGQMESWPHNQMATEGANETPLAKS